MARSSPFPWCSPFSSPSASLLFYSLVLLRLRSGICAAAAMAPPPKDSPHTKTLDYIVVSVIAIGCVFLIVGNVIIFINRDYRPIKTRSVGLTVFSSLGGLIWISATLVVNDHFPRHKDTFWAVCPLWTYWLQVCFGFAVWLNCLTARLVTLYRIFIMKRQHFKHTIIVLFSLLLPAIIFCISATASKGIQFKASSSTPPREGDCKFDKSSGWAYGLLALVLLYYLIFLGLAFKLRNAMAQFNEFRLIRNGGIISLFLFLLSLVTLQTGTYEQVTGRCFLSVSVAVAVFYYFWARNGEVVYNVILDRQQYEQKFHAELARSPSEHDRERFPDTFRNRETHLKEVREQISRYHIRIKQLEDEINSMEKECNLFQRQSSAVAVL